MGQVVRILSAITMKQKTVQDEIFEKSQKLFRQKGYEAVTIDEICTAVGISKPTFYAKKLTKRALLLQAYSVDKLLELPVVDETNVLATLATLVDRMEQAMVCHGPELFRDLLKEHLKKPVFDLPLIENWKAYFVHLIEVGQQNGVILNQDDPRELVQLIQAYLLGCSFQYAMERDSEIHLYPNIAAILWADPQKTLERNSLEVNLNPRSSFSINCSPASFKSKNKH